MFDPDLKQKPLLAAQLADGRAQLLVYSCNNGIRFALKTETSEFAVDAAQAQVLLLMRSAVG